jgi:cellulose synthase/poly-beta-1,6-N-acetylglucosamine synthase-like glycosyltransferase
MDYQDSTIPRDSKAATPVHATAATPSAPVLSVIVPCYNSSPELERCLDALEQSTFNDFEVLVVDDGSTERIEPIVLKRGFRYLRIDGPGGPGRARNHGALHVAGTYVVFIDADVCVHRDTLAMFAETLKGDPSLAGVIGTYDDKPAHPGFVSQFKNLFHHYVHRHSAGPVTTFWSGCGALRRDLFLAAGGFDEVRYRQPAIEDIELGTWLAAAGHKIALEPRVQCQHLKRWSLANMIRTDVWGRGVPWTRLMLRSGKVVNNLNVTIGQRLCVALVYLALLLVPLGFWRREAWIAAAACTLLVTLLNRHFYQYFAAHRGVWFAIRSAPLHWIYFVCCGFCVVAGTLLHHLSGDRNATPPTIPSPGTFSATVTA